MNGRGAGFAAASAFHREREVRVAIDRKLGEILVAAGITRFEGYLGERSFLDGLENWTRGNCRSLLRGRHTPVFDLLLDSGFFTHAG